MFTQLYIGTDSERIIWEFLKLYGGKDLVVDMKWVIGYVNFKSHLKSNH